MANDGGDVEALETMKAVVEVDEDGNKSVNEYLLIKTIGKGSFAKVKLCLNTKDNELYAMKVCHKAMLAKRRRGLGNALDHIWREVDILKRLHHPNVVALKQVINDPQLLHLYIVFEYLELGPVMRDIDGTPLEMEFTRSYFYDVLQGLYYLHSRNVIHCDLKPDNLLVNAEGKVKIIDFGSSRYVGMETPESSEGLVCHEVLEGTPAFMAPELCSSAYSPAEASKFPRDVWALGVCLYCFVTGRLPFLADNVMEMYDKIKNDEPSFDGIDDESLVSLLRGAMEKDPSQRLTLTQIQEHPWVLATATFLSSSGEQEEV